MYEMNCAKGRMAERYACMRLNQAGINAVVVECRGVMGTPDLITDGGIYIDVKYSLPFYKRNNPSTKYYKYNLHHHGAKQTNIDYFIFVLGDIVWSPLFVFPATLCDSKTYKISEKQILGGELGFFRNNFDIIKANPGRPNVDFETHLARWIP